MPILLEFEKPKTAFAVEKVICLAISVAIGTDTVCV